MADFSRLPQRFYFTGLSTLPADALPAGKLPYGKNIRSYEEGSLVPRYGVTKRSASSLGAAIHTLARLNDPTPFNSGDDALRVVGSGDEVYTGDPSGTAYSEVDDGYSGDPLTTVVAQPPQSPRPYIYIADRLRQRKFTTNGSPLEVGIAQPALPTTAPGVAVQQIKLPNLTDIISSTAWLAAGTVATNAGNVARIATVIGQILYDSGSSGYCSIAAASMVDMTVGTILTIGDPLGSFENMLITDLTIAITPTTVEAIIYDSGSTGLCTIQPVGSLGVGQLEAPSIQSYRRRAYQRTRADQLGRLDSLRVGNQGQRGYLPTYLEHARSEQEAERDPNDVNAGVPPDPAERSMTRRIRQVDFPVNSLVILNGGETVRILSVAVGQDGVQSFRCSTSTTISAGQTITGIPALRGYLQTTRTAGEQITNGAVENVLTYPILPNDTEETIVRMVGGIQGVLAINLAQFEDGTAVLPEDEVHVAIKVDRLTEVTAIRVYFDVDPTTNDFLENYYFYEWRASDIVTAIQGTNAAVVTPLADARRTTVSNQQLERIFNAPGAGGGWQFNNKARATSTANAAMAEAAESSQLSLGNNQWIDLRCRVGQLIRVGTDTTRTLANVAAIEMLVAAETIGSVDGDPVVAEPLTVQYDDIWIAGGGGPDVGAVGDPYVYAYRYRSSETGAVSNGSPPSRGGVIPRRQNVSLTPVASADPQVDKIDWFRFGATLTRWTYIGTGQNSATPYVDSALDTAVDGGEPLANDNYQLWPVQDLPHTGTCDVAGTAIRRVGGDTFDTAWAPGSVIVINGRATTIYAVASTSLLHVNDNMDSGSAVPFTLIGPTLLSQPMGRFWGDYHGTYFGCGDPINPGTLYWTKTNNPEVADDRNSLIVTPPSEPLQGGGVYNTFPFVASTQELYQILRDQTGSFRAIKTPCGRGFWTPWAWCASPQGIIFLAEDGIFLTAAGSVAQPIHPPDLRTIFPKDGVPGTEINGIPAPDMTETSELRLSYIAGFIYFDYVDDDGDYHTLIMELGADRWFFDESDLTSLRVRLEEPGEGVYDQIIGGGDGNLYRYDEAAILDDTEDLDYALWTPWVDAGAPRVVKQFGDVILNVNPQNSIGGITVQVVSDDGEDLEAPVSVGAGETGRYPYVIDLDAGGGLLARNLGLRVSGTLGSSDTGRPQFYLWEPSFVAKIDTTIKRATDWENLGYVGAKFVQGVIIRANTFGNNKSIQVQKDGGVPAQTFTINHDGEVQMAYPIVSTGWDPFITELIRIVGMDDVDWQLLDYRFVWEPAPELATQWETQFTNHDWTGFGTVRDMILAWESTTPLTFTLTYDDRDLVHTIPSSGGVYKRDYFPLCPGKGKAVRYRWETSEPARLYKRDTVMRIQPWGAPGGYRDVNPFGGPSRADGAAI